MPYFGSPAVVLADRGVFDSAEFRNYVVHDLQARLHLTSAEYPEGNGINESCHRILETAIKTHVPDLKESFQDIVAEAVLVYNATPNKLTGESPMRLLYGQDPIMPGFASFVLREGEEARQLGTADRRQFAFLQELLEDLEAHQQLSANDYALPYAVDNIVTYELTKSERKRHPHYSGCDRYKAVRSLPHRVVKVSSTNVMLRPLWRRGKGVDVPITKCRRLVLPPATRMHRLVHQVYPSPDALHLAGQPALTGINEDATPPTSSATVKSPRKRPKSLVTTSAAPSSSTTPP